MRVAMYNQIYSIFWKKSLLIYYFEILYRVFSEESDVLQVITGDTFRSKKIGFFKFYGGLFVYLYCFFVFRHFYSKLHIVNNFIHTLWM